MLPLHLKSQLRQPGGVLDPVGIINLAGRPCFPQSQQFAAGGQHPYPQGAEDRHFCIALACQHPQMGRGQDFPFPGNDGAGGDIFTPEHHILVWTEAGINLYRLLTAVAQLLHQNAVGAFRQRGPGHNPGGTARRQNRRRCIPGIELHCHRQGDRVLPVRPCGIRTMKGIAVQRAAVEGRLIHPGAEGPGCYPAPGFFQGDIFHGRPGQGRRCLQNAAQRLGGRAKRLFHPKILQSPGRCSSAMAQMHLARGDSVLLFNRQV